MDKLLEYNNYSTGTKLIFFAFLLASSIINFAGLAAQHDFVLVLIELILLGYAVPCYIMHKFIDDKIQLKIAAKDIGTEDPKVRAKATLLKGLVIGLVLGAVLIIWSKFIPFGPKIVLLEMPLFNSRAKEAIYWVVFALLWVLVLPAAEVTFFFMFQACVWNESWTNWLIAGVYALMNWCWLWFCVGDWWWTLVFAGIAFGLALYFLKYRDSHGGIEVIGMRIGIAIGILAVLIFLLFSAVSAKTPVLFFKGDWRNIWTKGDALN